MKVNDIEIRNDLPFTLIAGPCVVESREHATMMASELQRITDELRIPFIFKASFDKANRTSLGSFRSIGFHEALRILDDIRSYIDVPVLTDIHDIMHVDLVAKYVDILHKNSCFAAFGAIRID